ncbi:hypothetical protein BKI52_37955 [marine bacterium AO1-C]|nr:hypothetical protein BKI52_37955 [marine bacterium AO1-C]
MKLTLLKAFFTILLFSLSTITFAQTTRTITGKVTDQKGAPLPGVSINQKGAEPITTNSEGVYEIQVPDNQEISLIFSYFGYVSITEKIENRKVINVVLRKATVKKRRPNTVASHQIATDNFKYSTDIFKAIQNQSAGAWITTSSGSPGAATQVLLRGHRSIQGNNSPLIIIDGMPIINMTIGNSVASVDQSNRLMDISPQNIESLEVLNSFSPRLLRYGMQARNGAVIIKTKKGQFRQKPQVTFFTRFSSDRVNRLPELQNQYAQGLPGTVQPIYQGPETQNQYAWGPPLASLSYNGTPDGYDNKGRLIPNSFTGPGALPAVAYDPYDFFVGGFTFETNLAVNGGNEKYQYYISAGRMQRNGFVPLSTFYRNSILFSSSLKASKSLTLSSKLHLFSTHGQRIQKGSGASSVTRGIMRTPPSFDNSNENGSGFQAIRQLSTFITPLDNALRSFSRFGVENPYASVRNPYSDNVNGQLFQFNLDWKIASNWRLDATLFFDSRNEERNIAFDIFSATINEGFYGERIHNLFDFYLTTALHYSRKLGQNLDLNASVGFWRTFQTTQSQFASVSPLRTLGDFSLDTGNNFGRTDASSDHTLQNIYAQFSVNYLKSIFLEAGIVNINHSIINNTSSVSPSAGLAIDVTQLLLPKNKIFSKLLLSANYSQIGGDANIYSRGLTNISTSRLTLALGTNGNNIPFSVAADNPELRQETTTMLDFGVQVNLLEGRIQFQGNHFNATSTDQIVNNTNNNGINALVNGGTVTTDGWEFQLMGQLIKTRNLSWMVGVNLTRFHSVVTDLPDNISRINLGGFNQFHSSATNGQPYGVFYGNNFQRNGDGQLIIANDGFPTLGIPGPTGNPTPDWLWGVTSSFRWKGLRVDMRWDVRRGGDVWNGTQASLDFFGTSKRSGDQRVITGFVYPGVKLDGSTNDIPVDFYNLNPGTVTRISPLTAFGEFGIAEANIQDASWIRFRELIIAYTFPKAWTQGLSLSELTVSFIGRNLFLITDYTGVDPETNLTGDTNGFGIDFYNMPQTRSIGGSISFRF